MSKRKEISHSTEYKFSFEQVYRKFWKRLYIICYQKTENSEASEEMVQEIFTTLWRKKIDISEIHSVEGYLVVCAKNKVMDYYRKNFSSKALSLELCGLCTEPGFDIKSLEHNEAMDRFLKDDLELVVGQLPCQCQKVYRLSREENLSTKEIADLLSISPKTVKNHITNALKHIRAKMDIST